MKVAGSKLNNALLLFLDINISDKNTCLYYTERLWMTEF